MRLLICLLAAAAALASAHARAEVYKWVDKDGRIHYSDSPPGNGARVLSIQDRLSLYSPEPGVAQVLRTPPRANPATALADRVATLERQLQSERIARQPAVPDARAAYERCLAERRTDCDQLLSGAASGPRVNAPTALRGPQPALRPARAS
jgi:uncharacterized protein DUF4124